MSLSTPNPIEASNPYNSAIVKASAGVGKTYLLVTRLIRLLLIDVRPDAILAITFTRKAAAEMQSRLFDRLYLLATVNSEDLISELKNIGVEPSAVNQKKARGLYEFMLRHESRVKTNTFHAFCQEILRKFPLESDVPPGFELLNDEPSYMAAAWDLLYEKVTQQPESETAHALEKLYDLAGGLWNTQACLNSFVRQRSDWWAFSSAFKNPAQDAAKKCLTMLDVDLDSKPYAQLFSKERKTHLSAIIKLLAMHNTATNLKYVAALEEVIQSKLFSPSFSESDYHPLISKIRAVFFKANGEMRFDKPVKSRAKKMTDAGEDEFLELCLSLCVKINAANDIAKKQHNYHFNAAWYIAGEALLQQYQQLKQQQRLLDFTDLEWRTFSLLNHSENATWVQYKLDQRIDHLLVDEFQDTNPTQWRLLLPLMQEFISDDERLRSVFLVGDEKQSIYSFRRADPQLFFTASDWLIENLNASAFPMDKSRRSAMPVMNLLNNVFMSDDFKQQLPDFQSHSTFLSDTAGKITLLPLIEPSNNKEEPIHFRNSMTTPLPAEEDLFYHEGQQIAGEIENLINNKQLIDNGNTRCIVGYKDIMLLIRSRKHLSSYEAALREANIPYSSNNKGTLFECQEIQDLIALLEVLYTPYNNLSVATVLRSPVFKCSNDDLLFMADKIANRKNKSWFAALQENTDTDEWPTALTYAADCIARWQSHIGHLPIHDLLDKIFSEGNIFERYNNQVPAHFRDRVKSNLTQFLSFALEIDSGRYPSLGRFIAKLHSLIQNDASPDEYSNNSDEGSVRILTIHGAKGLEAPIVFLADAADSNREKSRSYSSLVNWPEEESKPSTFIICPKKENQITLVSDLLAIQKTKTTIEDANLLYVALTRTRQFLYISGCDKVKGEIEKLGWYGLLKKHWPDDELTETTFSGETLVSDEPIIKPMNIITFPTLFFDDGENQNSINQEESAAIEDDEAKRRGIIIHRLIELMSNNLSNEPNAIKAQIAAEFSLDTSSNEFVTYYEEANKTIHHPNFASIFDNKNIEFAFNEMPIQIKTRTGFKHGIIDRLIINNDKIIIIDYKTHHGIEKEKLREIAESYQPQLQRYEDAVLKLWPNATIKKIILFTHYLLDIEVK